MDDPPRAARDTRLLDGGTDQPAARAQRLLQVLAEVRRGRQSIPERYDILRQCLTFAAALRKRLDELGGNATLPPPSDQVRLARHCADAYRLMSDCFRTIAEEFAALEAGPLSDANRISHSCFWGINCLGHYIVIRSDRYLKPGTGVWLDVHRLYDLAVSEGLEALPLRGRFKRIHTVDSAYKRVLLLGLSDPFQHPDRGLGRLYDKLNEWAPLTHLSTADKPTTRCLFLVDPRLDRPASPALSQAAVRPEFNQKWFVTRDLITRLKQEFDQAVARPDNVSRARQTVGADELRSVEFLRRMIVRWGVHPVRTGARRKTTMTCNLVSGLKSVCMALDSNRLMPTAAAGHPASESAAGNDAGIQTSWEIEDESDNGLKLVSRPAGSFGIGVDDLVAVSTDRSPDWSVGTVHWAQTDESGVVALGIRMFAQTVRPVLLHRLHAGASRMQKDALLLVEHSDDGLRRSLICLPAAYDSAAVYLAKLPGSRGEFVVEAGNVLLSSRAFVWFEVIKSRR
jgi:hypothetical protein